MEPRPSSLCRVKQTGLFAHAWGPCSPCQGSCLLSDSPWSLQIAAPRGLPGIGARACRRRWACIGRRLSHIRQHASTRRHTMRISRKTSPSVLLYGRRVATLARLVALWTSAACQVQAGLRRIRAKPLQLPEARKNRSAQCFRSTSVAKSSGLRLAHCESRVFLNRC